MPYTAVTDSTGKNSLAIDSSGRIKAGLEVSSGAVSTTNPVPVKSVQTIVSATVTRPADTNAYAANDVVSNSTSSPTILTFADVVAAVGGKGLITGGVMNLDYQSTPSIRLMLFHGTAPTAINDNAAFSLSDADSLKCFGWLDFDTYQAGGANTIYQDFTKLLLFTCGAALKDIYGIPVVMSAFTPTASAKKTFSLNIVRL